MTCTVSVRAELRSDSQDVATPTPRLSWMTSTDAEGWLQAGAEIQLDGDTTVEIVGRDAVLVAWPFAPIAPRGRHRVRVRVTGEDGSVSAWSEPVDIVGAFLGDGEWAAEWIAFPAPTAPAQPMLFRREFEVRPGLHRATLYATAHGVYDAFVNGTDVDDQVMKPGWTPYASRLVHETTDVTQLLEPGANVLGISVAGGWYTFRPLGDPAYGSQPAVAAQLRLDYADGTVQLITTDGSWQASADGPVRSSDVYDGETYDAGSEILGWAEPGSLGPASRWFPVSVLPSAVTPTARNSPAVRSIEELAVSRVLTSASGRQLLDFGQNLVGRLRIRLTAEPGTRVVMRHAEVLEDDELGVRPLRAAKVTDTYIARGDGTEVWEPAFTFHGFRYAEITGVTVRPEDVTAVVIHSDLRRTGWFTSSNDLLDRLHENIVWGMRGNFFYLPTDCPQRDERLGWTGDIQVFAPTASFLFDTEAFLSSWLEDLTIEQRAAGGGIVPFVVPNVLHDAATPAAAWGDAATVVPTVLHERFGDRDVLAAQYPSMQEWSDCLLDRAGPDLIWTGDFQFGDWLDPTAPPHNAFLAKTDIDLVATAYLYRSVTLTAEAARLLGLETEARHYAERAAAVRRAFLAEYVTPAGRMVSDSQTAYAMAISFGLHEPVQRAPMGDRLAEFVRSGGYRIATGFVGTPLVCDALTATGHLDSAARLLLQTECPSWLYPVTMGATTVWERWDSMLEDGSINPGEMTSFNHYALGAVADWLHRCLAGLGPAEPGYRTLRIAPHPIDQLDHAEATFDTPYGRARSGWRRQGDQIVVQATVPANTTAVVQLPGAAEELRVGSGRYEWSVPGARAELPTRHLDRTTALADIIDDVEAYEAVMGTADRVDPAAAKRLRTSTVWSQGAPLSQILNLVPAPVGAAVDEALAAVNDRRGRPRAAG